MKKKIGRVILVSENEAEMEAQIANKRFQECYAPLVRLLAEALDDAANGSNTWVSIGTTRDKTALALKVHAEDGDLSCFAGTLAGLSLEAKDLL